MTNDKIEKYKIMQKFALNEGHVLWSFSQTFIVANTIILAFISQRLTNDFLNKPNLLVFLLSIIGLLITILWLSSYRRRSKYYEFRVAQLRILEPNDWQFVDGIGKDFSDGKRVKVHETDNGYQLDFLGRPRTRLIATTFIFIFITIYMSLLIITFPFNIQLKNIDVEKNCLASCPSEESQMPSNLKNNPDRD